MNEAPMTIEEATEFFSEFYNGEHHIPGKIKKFGDAYSVQHPQDLATYDFNALTKIVFLAHDKCYRLAIRQGGPGSVKIIIWKRHTREGKIWEKHPTIEEALEAWRENHPKVD